MNFDLLRFFWNADNGSNGCCSDDKGCCSCNDEGEESGEVKITMIDEETNEEYEFVLADDFAYNDSHFCVLLTDDAEDPEYIIVRVVSEADGTEALRSLSDEEEDEVYAEYERILAEEEGEEEDEVQND